MKMGLKKKMKSGKIIIFPLILFIFNCATSGGRGYTSSGFDVKKNILLLLSRSLNLLI